MAGLRMSFLVKGVNRVVMYYQLQQLHPFEEVAGAARHHAPTSLRDSARPAQGLTPPCRSTSPSGTREGRPPPGPGRPPRFALATPPGSAARSSSVPTAPRESWPRPSRPPLPSESISGSASRQLLAECVARMPSPLLSPGRNRAGSRTIRLPPPPSASDISTRRARVSALASEALGSDRATRGPSLAGNSGRSTKRIVPLARPSPPPAGSGGCNAEEPISIGPSRPETLCTAPETDDR